MLSKIKSKALRERVERILRTEPSNRDNDGALIANIYQEEAIALLGLRQYNILNSHDGILTLMATGKVSSAESIRRVRQKIQEEKPELRGKNYRARQKHSVQVRQAINH